MGANRSNHHGRPSTESRIRYDEHARWPIDSEGGLPVGGAQEPSQTCPPHSEPKQYSLLGQLSHKPKGRRRADPHPNAKTRRPRSNLRKEPRSDSHLKTQSLVAAKIKWCWSKINVAKPPQSEHFHEHTAGPVELGDIELAVALHDGESDLCFEQEACGCDRS